MSVVDELYLCHEQVLRGVVNSFDSVIGKIETIDDRLIEFLKFSLQQDTPALQKARSEVYKVVADLVKESSSKWWEEVYELSYAAFNMETGSFVKTNSLLPMIEVLKLEGFVPTNPPNRSETVAERLYYHAYSHTMMGKTLTASVRRQCLVVLGLLVQKCPDEFKRDSEKYRLPLGEKVRDLCFSLLSKQDNALLEGAFVCMQSLLDEFPVVDMKKLYTTLAASLNVTSKSSLPREACILLIKHVSVFAKFEDGISLFVKLVALSKSTNRNVKYVAFEALLCLLDEIGERICENGNKDLLNLYMNPLNSMLKDPSSSNRDIEIAVNGIGSLAKGLKAILPTKVFEGLWVHLKDASDRLDSGSEFLKTDQILRHSRFLNSYSKIMKQLDAPDRVIIDTIVGEIKYLSEQYTNLHRVDQRTITKSLALAFPCLDDDSLSECISTMVTFSIQTLLEDQQVVPLFDSSTGLRDGRLFFQYHRLWLNLLPLSTNIFTEFIRSVHKLILVLELEVIPNKDIEEENDNMKEEEFCNMNDPDAVRPKNPAAIVAFNNLIELVDKLDIYKHPSIIDWRLLLAQTVLEKSIAHPLMSGFYRFMKILFLIPNPDQSFLAVARVFVQHAILRSKEYKDELLASCLSCVLKSPHAIVTDSFVNVIERALEVGQSFPTCAHEAIDAMEEWFSKQLVDVVRLLPVLGKYLSWSDDKVSQKIIVFLGRIGGRSRLAISDEFDQIKKDHLVLKELNLYPNVEYSIVLDTIIPHVVKLAETCVDRQTKTASCEFLHAVILHSLGNEHDVQSLMPTMFRLAVDPEPVATQLFRPLVAQIAAWTAHSVESHDLIQACIDGVECKTNGPLKEVCAQTLGHFFTWSIKKNTMANAITVLQRICFLLKDPDPYRRLGACLLFEHLYRVFREEEKLVESHILKLLYNTASAMQMAQNDDEQMGTMKASSVMLNRICRIMARMHDAHDGHLEYLFKECSSVYSGWRKKAQQMFQILGPPEKVASFIDDTGMHDTMIGQLDAIAWIHNTYKLKLPLPENYSKVFDWKLLSANLDLVGDLLLNFQTQEEPSAIFKLVLENMFTSFSPTLQPVLERFLLKISEFKNLFQREYMKLPHRQPLRLDDMMSYDIIQGHRLLQRANLLEPHHPLCNDLIASVRKEMKPYELRVAKVAVEFGIQSNPQILSDPIFFIHFKKTICVHVLHNWKVKMAETIYFPILHAVCEEMLQANLIVSSVEMPTPERFLTVLSEAGGIPLNNFDYRLCGSLIANLVKLKKDFHQDISLVKMIKSALQKLFESKSISVLEDVCTLLPVLLTRAETKSWLDKLAMHLVKNHLPIENQRLFMALILAFECSGSSFLLDLLQPRLVENIKININVNHTHLIQHCLNNYSDHQVISSQIIVPLLQSLDFKTWEDLFPKYRDQWMYRKNDFFEAIFSSPMLAKDEIKSFFPDYDLMIQHCKANVSNCYRLLCLMTCKMSPSDSNFIFTDATILNSLIDEQPWEDFSVETDFESLSMEKFNNPALPIRSIRMIETLRTPTQFSFDTSTYTSSSKRPLEEQPAAENSNPFERECEEDAMEPLELDCVNLLPCMTSTLAVLDSLSYRKNIKTYCLDALRSPNIKVRLFIVRLVVNRPTLFSVHAGDLVGPCIEAILAYKPTVFDYFTRDFCQTIGRWERLVPGMCPQIEILPTFLNHLMNVCPHKTTRIMNFNLQLIHMLISFVPQGMPLSRIPMLKFLQGEKMHKLAGLNLVGIFLDNHYELLAASQMKNLEKAFKSILSCLEFNDKRLKVVAAEVTGNLSQYCRDERLVDELKDILVRMYDSKQDHWLGVVNSFLSKANQEFTSIVMDQENMDRLMKLFLKLPPGLFLQALNIYSKCFTMESFENFQPCAQRLLKFESQDIKTVTLLIKVLKNFAQQVGPESINLVISVANNHRADTCRIAALDFIKVLYLDDPKPILLEAILQALSNKRNNLTLKQDLLSFLNEQLPKEIGPRIQLCKQFVDQWSVLLLSLTEFTNKPIFRKPLESNSSFDEFEINSSWKESNASSLSQMPLFASSQADSNIVLATQHAGLLFSQTQEHDMSSGFMGTQAIGRGVLPVQKKRRKIVPSSIGSRLDDMEVDMDMPPPASSSVGDGLPSHLVKRNFSKLASEDDSRGFFRLKAMTDQRKMQAGTKRKQHDLKLNVSLLRKYRKGDLPDIQILLEELINPLISVCQMEPSVSRDVLVALSIPEIISNQEVLDLLSSEDAGVVKCLHHVLKSYDKKLCTDPIAESAIRSRNLFSGIVALENYLVKYPDDNQAWLNLLRVYDGQGQDPDVVIGILRRLYAHDDDTLLALKAQLTGSYLIDMKKHKSNMSGRFLSDITSSERLYIFKNTLQCLVEQQEWGTLVEDMLLQSASLLTEWQPVTEQTLEDVQIVNDRTISIPMALWESEDAFVRPYIVAGMRTATERPRMIQFITNSGERHASWLNRWVPLEMVMAKLFDTKTEDARVDVQRYFTMFLEQWTDAGEKRSLLKSLANFVDVHQFFQHRNQLLDPKAVRSALSTLLSNWENSLPDVHFDSVETWDQTIFTRYACIYAFQRETMNQEHNGLIKSFFSRIYLKAASAACHHGKFSIAQRYIKVAEKQDVDNKLLWLSKMELMRGVLGIGAVSSSVVAKGRNILDIPPEETLLYVREQAAIYCLLADEDSSKKPMAESKLRSCVKIAPNDGTAYLELAKFLSNNPEEFAECILKAIRFGSLEAAAKLPRIFSLLTDTNIDIDSFFEQFQNIPTRSLVFWVPQLLALLVHPTAGKYAEVLVLRLCKDFPQSVIFSFNTTNESILEAGNKKLSTVARAIVIPHEFIAAFRHLNDPDRRVVQICKYLQRFGTRMTPQALRDFWKKRIVEELVDCPWKGSSVRKFVAENKKEITSLDLESDTDVNQMIRKIAEYRKKVYGPNGLSFTKYISKQRKPFLEDYSKYLAEYKGEIQIQIPGQEGLHPPIIRSFEPQVTVMSSKEKPKKITMRGDDEKEYSFLVKGGDDLRLDQRIQQLFAVMNTLFDQCLQCSQRQLRLKTYQVIPLSIDIGLVEWVDDVVPLKSAIESSMPAKSLSKRSSQSRSPFNDSWLQYCNKLGSKGDWHAEQYATAAATKPVDRVLPDLFQSDDLLKNFIVNLSTSPEGFLAIRKVMLNSISVNSVCGYVLGIGDRHLENLMLCKATGEMFHIDFGMVFGTSVVSLAVPELSPFRLTRQMQGIVKPLDITSTFLPCMTPPLATLRAHKDNLMAVMEVFIHEPTVDWELVTEATKGNEFVSSDTDTRLEITKMKLDGVHPVSVLMKQLKTNKFAMPALKKYESLLGPVTDQLLDTSEQVERLIEIATNPAVLTTHYVGWSPFA